MVQRKKSQQQVISPNLRGISIAAMIVGIIGVVISFVPWYGFPAALAALVLGIIGLVKHAPHRSMSVAGVILGGAGILLGMIFLIVWIVVWVSSGTPANNPVPYTY